MVVTPLELYQQHEHMVDDAAWKFRTQFPYTMREDVRSEARLALWRAAKMYNGYGSFGGFAWVCVMRKLMNMAKVYKRYRIRVVDHLENVASGQKPSDDSPRLLMDVIGTNDAEPCQQDTVAAIMDVVNKVGEPALILRCTTGLSDTEIGRRLGLDQETITRRIRTARRRALPMLKWRGLIA